MSGLRNNADRLSYSYRKTHILCMDSKTERGIAMLRKYSRMTRRYSCDTFGKRIARSIAPGDRHLLFLGEGDIVDFFVFAKVSENVNDKCIKHYSSIDQSDDPYGEIT